MTARGALLIALGLWACGGTPAAPATAPSEPADAPAAATAPAPVEDEPAVDGASESASREPIAGRGTLRGTVTNLATGRPLAGATVFVRTADGAMVTDTTNRRGEFTLRDLPAGSYELTVSLRKLDFRKQVDVEAASETVLSLPVSLDPSRPIVVD